ncbi:nucleotidyltransferase domain-containing protein [Filobacillus milosensis]|uniref:Nucleotidyltransferase domain-containing protein n=1 Tax=Filobacillus milosensis TaxID=94137 RepID=A0A4Y8IQH9_9BACI|nr:nucleotidyltransferase domain-containing protein [Filobacillus milosensis]
MLDVAIKYLKDKINPEYIILFGSQKEGLTHPKSDIDLAYYSIMKITPYELFLIAQELADLIGYDVDLIDLSEATTVMKAQIFYTGEVIFCNNEKVRQEHHMYSYRMYAKLNEEREVILDRIKESGSVYGE